MGTYNGNKNQGQTKLANALVNTGVPTIVISLRDPYDLGSINKEAFMLAGYEYSPRCFDAIDEIIGGNQKATGQLSVTL